MAPDFRRSAPTNKISAIVDPEGPDGKRVSIFEVTGRFLHLSRRRRTGKFSRAAEASAFRYVNG